MKGNIPEKMRKRNLHLILQALSSDAAMSVKELSDYTGLSVVSIHKLLEILINDHLIKESVQIAKTRGRSATQYILDYEAFSILSVRIFEGPQNMIYKMEIIDLAGKRLSSDIVENKIDSLETLTLGIKRLLSETDAQPKIIILGIPGVEVANKLLISDIKDWSQLNLANTIAQSTDIFTKVVNDVNAVAYGAIGKVNPDSSAIALYYPLMFAPGSAIIINGKTISGVNGTAGEIASSSNYEHQIYPIDNINNAVQRDIQNLTSLIDPKYVMVYAPQHQLDIASIQKKLHSKGPLFKDYQLIFNGDFDDDYCFGLLRFGRELVYNKLIN